jgi:hypothetical protein
VLVALATSVLPAQWAPVRATAQHLCMASPVPASIEIRQAAFPAGDSAAARLAVQVMRARDSLSLLGMGVFFYRDSTFDASNVEQYAGSDSLGWTRFSGLPPRRYVLRIRGGLTYTEQDWIVEARRGFSDTIRLFAAEEVRCGTYLILTP